MQNGFRFSIRNDDKEQLYLTVNKEKQQLSNNWAQATLLPTRWKSTFWGWEFSV
jgi:hypothetical protein